MKNKITAVALMALMLFLVACSKNMEVTTPEGQEAVENLKPEDSLENLVETEEATNETEENTEEKDVVEQLIVKPLPSVINLEALEDSILPISMNSGDIYKDDNGVWKIKATVYDYEVFDIAEINQLKVGDIIVLNTQEILIEQLEETEFGDIKINGGLDENGFELWTAGENVYFEHGYSDVKSYFSVGEIELELVEDFVLIDESQDEEHVTVIGLDTIEDAMVDYEGYYTPHSTFLTIESGKAFEVRVIYTP